jgi:hypothetical protein
MVEGKSAFFDQDQVDKWDARETGQALRPILAKIGRLNRTEGNLEQIRSQLEGDPDVTIGLSHLTELMRSPTR